jgi:hypothetical protein
LDHVRDVYPYEIQIVAHLGEMDRETDSVIGHLQRDVEETYNLGAIIFQDNDLAFWPEFKGCDNLQVKIAIYRSLHRRTDAVEGNSFSGPAISASEMLEFVHRLDSFAVGSSRSSSWHVMNPTHRFRMQQEESLGCIILPLAVDQHGGSWR